MGWSRIRGKSGKRVVLSFFDSVLLSNAKRLTTKVFLEVTLVSLTIEHALFFKTFEKNGGKFAVLGCCTAAN